MRDVVLLNFLLSEAVAGIGRNKNIKRKVEIGRLYCDHVERNIETAVQNILVKSICRLKCNYVL